MLIASSGTTATVTVGAGAADLITAQGFEFSGVMICNEGSVAGFFSLDGGTTWGRLPVTSIISLDLRRLACNSIKIKRDGVSDMAGVYGFAW